MTPFQQLQVWFRRASTAARTNTVVALLVFVALVAWLVTPVHQGGSTTSLQTAEGALGGTSSGTAPGGGTASTSGPSTGGGTSSSGGATPGGSVSSGGSGPRGNPSTQGGTGGGGTIPTAHGTGVKCPPTVGQGTTDSKITVAVTIVDLTAVGDKALGVPTPAEQQSDWQWVTDAINASGGVACRKLDMKYYNVNPGDSNNTQQQCLAIADSHPFMAIDAGSLISVGAADCIPAQKVPLIGIGLTKDQLNKYYPYYIVLGDIADNWMRDGVQAWKQLGYLSDAKGFAKVGVLYRTCQPIYYNLLRKDLAEAGVPDNAIIAYNLGCPTGGHDNAADFAQAVLTFKNAGVTHVTEVGGVEINEFTQVAAQQNWKPKQYLFVDNSLLAVTAGNVGPNDANFDGAIDITNTRYGEDRTPGYKPNGATAQCNAIFAAQKQPPVYQQPAGYGGVICALLYYMQAIINHAPQLNGGTLVSGMHNIGTLDLSYPGAPEDFSAPPPGSAYGRGLWRLDEYRASCSCWLVPNSAFNPPFR